MFSGFFQVDEKKTSDIKELETSKSSRREHSKTHENKSLILRSITCK